MLDGRYCPAVMTEEDREKFAYSTMLEGSHPAGKLRNTRVYWLACIAYLGNVLPGYDNGVASGVVTQKFFQSHFGLNDKNSIIAVSSNIVSVLQAGAFFGALGSAPMSSRIGRKFTLLIFTITLSVGSVVTIISGGSRGLSYIYAGRVISGIGIGGITAVTPTFVCRRSQHVMSGTVNGISIHSPSDARVWRVPFGLQLVPVCVMAVGLLATKESPRYLASRSDMYAARANLAYLRRLPTDHHTVVAELAEIEAAIVEEREARKGLGLKDAFFGKGNFVRFLIAFTIFLFQQWSGQNSVGYYAPLFFTSIGFTGAKNSLLASGIYGIVKVIATAFFVVFGVETLGRRPLLLISSIGMGLVFFVVGAVLKTYPPPAILPEGASPPKASQAMAAMLYIYVCLYSMGWGPLPWVYVSDIFPTRTRHYGMALASASQWLWTFVVGKVTPTLEADLGYKLFFMFAAINIGGMAVFSLLIPETKGRSLEEMDIIFGAVSREERENYIRKQEQVIKQQGFRDDVGRT